MGTEGLAASLNRRFRRKILALPQAERAVTASASRCHPLIDAVHSAFSQHYPLTLFRDAIWLTIAQGFGHHVAEKAEALRGRMVRHQGRRELVAKVLGFESEQLRGRHCGLFRANLLRDALRLRNSEDHHQGLRG